MQKDPITITNEFIFQLSIKIAARVCMYVHHRGMNLYVLPSQSQTIKETVLSD